jgi:predicted enzyme related to lactoylglutathione lyase
LDGGFFKANLYCQTSSGAALLDFYSADTQATRQKVIDSGSTIIKSLFDFFGGRFHFTEPSGNEFAVWSEGNSALLPLSQKHFQVNRYFFDSLPA